MSIVICEPTISSNKGRSPYRGMDLNGKRFGKLVVLHLVDDSEGSKRGYRICKCDCGNVIEATGGSLCKGYIKSCGCLADSKGKARIGSNAPNWRGGRTLNSAGYVLIKKPDHPNAWKSGYVLEHIYVMSDFIGRALRKGETVHHKNGIKTDNRLENLQLHSSWHLKGQSVDDVIEFCVEYLSAYAPGVLVKPKKVESSLDWLICK